MRSSYFAHLIRSTFLPTQQYAIKTSGGVRLESFDEFIQSPNPLHQAHAAFHIVVLARVIVNSDQVTLSARGVELLVTLLSSDDHPTQILSASLTASLGHTRAGIPAALITSGKNCLCGVIS